MRNNNEQDYTGSGIRFAQSGLIYGGTLTSSVPRSPASTPHLGVPEGSGYSDYAESGITRIGYSIDSSVTIEEPLQFESFEPNGLSFESPGQAKRRPGFPVPCRPKP